MQWGLPFSENDCNDIEQHSKKAWRITPLSRCGWSELVLCLKKSRNPIQVLISNNYSTPITSPLHSPAGLSFLSISPTTTSHFLSTVSLPAPFSLSFALSSVISIPFFLSPSSTSPPTSTPAPKRSGTLDVCANPLERLGC